MKGKKKEAETKPQGSYPCPYCDDAPKKSKAGLAAHIRLKHPELSVQKEQEKKEPPVENPVVKPVVLQRDPPKQPTMGEEIEAQVIKENAAAEAEREPQKVEVVQEEKPPEAGLDVMTLLGESGISVEMINATLSKAPIVAGLSVALKTVEQKLLDVVDVMSAMNEQMKPLLALYEHYKPMIEKQATESPETEHPELSPEEQQHIEARKLAEISGQPGADGGREAGIERYIQYGLRAMELAKATPQGDQASPAQTVQKNLLDSLTLVNNLNAAARSNTIGEFKQMLDFFKELSKGGMLAKAGSAEATEVLPHKTEIKTE